MLSEIQDGDAIFSTAIEMDSAEERDAYISSACGKDAALRQQVEERVAAHFQARDASEKPSVVAASGRKSEHSGGKHEADRHESMRDSSHPHQEARKYPRGLVVTVASLLLAIGVAGGVLTIRALRIEEQARTAVQQADEERERAQKEAKELKRQLDAAEAATQRAVNERDRELAVERTAQRSSEDTKAVLAFFQDRMLSVGRPKGWAGGQWAEGWGKSVTLLDAVNAAESKVAEVFADRPLAEASIREMLGSTYLDLGEASKAVKQFERALALRQAILGPDQSETVGCRNKLAVAYRLAGRSDEASRLYDQNLESPSHAAALAIQGSMLLAQKKYAEAELKLRERLDICQKIQPDDWTTFDAKAMLGEAFMAQKKYNEAEPLLLSGYEGMKNREAKLPPDAKARLTKTLERLVQLYDIEGKKDKAAQWRKTLEAAKSTSKP
jgi:tetratricopeptide (TPR) repeat protein